MLIAPKYKNGDKVVVLYESGELKVNTVTTIVSWDGFDPDFREHTYGVVDDPTTWYLETELEPYRNGLQKAVKRVI